MAQHQGKGFGPRLLKTPRLACIARVADLSQLFSCCSHNLLRFLRTRCSLQTCTEMTPQVTLEGQHFWRPRAAAERGSAPERQLPSPLDHYHRPSEPGTQPPVYDVGGESSNRLVASRGLTLDTPIHIPSDTRTSDEELEETDLAIGIELDSPLSCGSPADTFPDSLVEGTSSTDEARHESMPTHGTLLNLSLISS